MKKFVLGILTALWLWIWTIFAQNILPDSAEIEVKNPIIEWEATNLAVTIMKNWSKMNNYEGTVYFTIEEADWTALKPNEYTLPNGSIYSFVPTDLWSKEFQKWLEIKKEWTFYIQVEDLNDPDEKILWRQEITVIKSNTAKWDYHVEIYSPLPESDIPNEKIDILGSIPELPNSKALVYIDNNPAETVNVDSTWIINYPIWNLDLWKHTLRIEIPDIDWTILWTSDKISFNVIEANNVIIKDVTVYPEKLLMVWDNATVTVLTDEMVESMKMKLSDRSNDGLIMTKDWVWEFSYKVYLVSTWDINISLETTTSNNSSTQTHENVKQIHVIDTPEIWNVKTSKDDENQTATLSWDILYWDPVTSYSIKYRWTGTDISGEEETENRSFTFKDVPYNVEINVNITPIWRNSLGLLTHWSSAQSKIIKFIITKPGSCWNWIADPWEDCTTCAQDLGDECPALETCWNWQKDEWENCWNCSKDLWDECLKEPRCTVENIATRTTKIWDSYYLIRDKVENVTKYIVYSSPSPDGLDKVKVYETSDTSYEYPFDYNAKEEQYMYFRIVWICDDWEELELTWATKIQVWPAENFFLLMCLTFLIYFWIKLFRETE